MVTNDEIKKVFAARLRHLLRRKHMTQTELAKGIGVTKTTISDYLKCERGPQIDMLYRIADYFHVTTDFLVGRSTCKTASREAIHKVTGLSDEAISFLMGTQKRSRGRVDSVTDGVNVLLENAQGRDILGMINFYVRGDAKRVSVLIPNKQNGALEEEAFDTYHFNLGRHAETSYIFPIKAANIANSLIFSIHEKLDKIRQTIHETDV